MTKVTKSQRDAVLNAVATVWKRNNPPKPKKPVAKLKGPAKAAKRQQAKPVAIKVKPVIGKLPRDLDTAVAIAERRMEKHFKKLKVVEPVPPRQPFWRRLFSSFKGDIPWL